MVSYRLLPPFWHLYWETWFVVSLCNSLGWILPLTYEHNNGLMLLTRILLLFWIGIVTFISLIHHLWQEWPICGTGAASGTGSLFVKLVTDWKGDRAARRQIGQRAERRESDEAGSKGYKVASRAPAGSRSTGQGVGSWAAYQEKGIIVALKESRG